MSISQAKSLPDSRRASRNWMVDTLVVAGVLAFGYFALTLETARQQGPDNAGPITVQSPLELLR